MTVTTKFSNKLNIVKKVPSIAKGLSYVFKSDKSEVLSIGKFIEDNAAKYPHMDALKYEDRHYTHKEFNEWVNRYAHFFQSKGIGKGDAVAVFLENRPEVVVIVAALAKTGAISALANATQRRAPLAHSFKLCDPKMYVIGEELLSAFEEVRSELYLKKHNLLCYQVDHTDHPCPEGFLDIEHEAANLPSENPASTGTIQLKDPCFYIYTSGTTGMPKASIMSHNRWAKALGAFGFMGLNLKPGETLYVALPFYHNNALTVSWGAATASGACIAIRRKFSATQFWEDTRKFNAVAFCYIGELCRYLMNQPRKPDDAENPVKKIIGNGMRPDIWVAFKERFAIPEVYEFYSASESNIAFFNLFNKDCTVGFCPAPYALVEYDIEADEPVRGPEGFLKRVQPGGTGLLLGEVSEKYSFDGYTDKKASEAKLMRDVFKKGDLWFNSGDLLKDQGYKHAQFVDRLGDTFRWKGENVSTNEVAEVLNGYAPIQESTVYGVQVPGTDGRAGMASIVSEVKAKDFKFDELYEHVCRELPHYARPVFLRMQEELTITATFKHRKVELKKEGFNPDEVKEPLYVLLPKHTKYTKLTHKVYEEIMEKKYSF
ncbi:long-chain-acyl-CoA synthetase [Deltaproteobacteria bacterium TL4]